MKRELRSILTKFKDSKLAKIFEWKSKIAETNELGMPFLSRNPKAFDLMLDFIKCDGVLTLKDEYMHDLLMAELRFFGLDKHFKLKQLKQPDSDDEEKEDVVPDGQSALEVLQLIAEQLPTAMRDVQTRKKAGEESKKSDGDRASMYVQALEMIKEKAVQ